MTSKAFKISFTIFAFFFVVLTSFDIIIDNRTKTSLFHIIIEVSLIIVVLLTTLGIWIFFRQSLKVKQELIEELDRELEYFHHEYKDSIQKLSDGISQQLESWGLSTSEKRVAIALIRGYPIKQIAANVGRRERTIRNQATSIYEKTGMTGRNDLAAFFLSELLPDPDDD